MSFITYIRSYRLFDIALFDLITAIIGLYLVIKWTFPNRQSSFHWSWTAVLLLPVSIISHLVFKTPTTLNFYLGLSERPLR